MEGIGDTIRISLTGQMIAKKYLESKGNGEIFRGRSWGEGGAHEAIRPVKAFDVTDIGPLFVASFKNANMIVVDKKTGTFFQQASFNLVIGKLHPYSLKMISFQILSWKTIKSLKSSLQVVKKMSLNLLNFQYQEPGKKLCLQN